MVYRLKPGLNCDISISTSINISMTNVHTCCISTRKVTYASALSMGVWDEARFKNGGGRNFSAAFAALWMPDTFFTHNFLITAAFISQSCECSVTSTNAKGIFLFVTSKSSEPEFVVEACAGMIAKCLGRQS